MALPFWNGSGRILRQNVWRRWMLAHNVPKPNGQVPQPELFGCSSICSARCRTPPKRTRKRASAAIWTRASRSAIGGWTPAGIRWETVGWPKTGTWEVDLKRFPHGLRAISDYAHSRGVKTIVWFEPERVEPDTWLSKNHPEWILGGGAGTGLLNLGNPQAREWLTEHVDQLMVEQGIDLYRQDFNMDPLSDWRGRRTRSAGDHGDSPRRGLLGLLGRVVKRHPGDVHRHVRSGGRRNDLETLRRAIPLWRTDYRCEPIGTQCCSYGISLWIPLSGTGAADADVYTFRSNMVPFTNCLFDVRSKTLDFALLRRLIGAVAQRSPATFSAISIR